LVELDVDAQASIVETFIGHGWTNRLSTFRLFKGARLMLSRRLLGTSGFVSLTDRVEIGEGASFVATTLAAGGADTRLDGDIRMAGEGAYAEAAGALLARGAQRHDANLVIHHAMPNGQSRQLWRSVADDRAICSSPPAWRSPASRRRRTGSRASRASCSAARPPSTPSPSWKSSPTT
jgi:Fe-S cluster assembly protein SufD